MPIHLQQHNNVLVFPVSLSEGKYYCAKIKICTFPEALNLFEEVFVRFTKKNKTEPFFYYEYWLYYCRVLITIG